MASGYIASMSNYSDVLWCMTCHPGANQKRPPKKPRIFRILTSMKPEWSRIKNYIRNKGARASDTERFNYVLSLMFKSYDEGYYDQAIKCSPSLNNFSPGLSAKLAEYDTKITSALRKGGFYAFILILINFLVASRNTTAARYVGIVLLLAVYSVVLIYPLQAVRRLSEERAAVWIFLAIRDLERREKDWESSLFRYGVARCVERAARNVERIPLGFRGIAMSARRTALTVSRAKAAAFRKLEALIVVPNSFTRTELIDRLKSDLCQLMERKWYELPEDAPAERVRSRWITVIQVSASVLIIGLAILIPILVGKTEPLYAPVAALLISVGLALLNIAGLSTGYLSGILKSDDK